MMVMAATAVLVVEPVGMIIWRMGDLLRLGKVTTVVIKQMVLVLEVPAVVALVGSVDLITQITEVLGVLQKHHLSQAAAYIMLEEDLEGKESPDLMVSMVQDIRVLDMVWAGDPTQRRLDMDPGQTE